MKNISLGKALEHCFSTASYWYWLIALTIVAIAIIVIATRAASKNGAGTGTYIAYFVALALFLGGLLYRPAEVAANTSEDQAAKGIYIGY